MVQGTSLYGDMLAEPARAESSGKGGAAKGWGTIPAERDREKSPPKRRRVAELPPAERAPPAPTATAAVARPPAVAGGPARVQSVPDGGNAAVGTTTNPLPCRGDSDPSSAAAKSLRRQQPHLFDAAPGHSSGGGGGSSTSAAVSNVDTDMADDQNENADSMQQENGSDENNEEEIEAEAEADATYYRNARADLTRAGANRPDPGTAGAAEHMLERGKGKGKWNGKGKDKPNATNSNGMICIPEQTAEGGAEPNGEDPKPYVHGRDVDSASVSSARDLARRIRRRARAVDAALRASAEAALMVAAAETQRAENVKLDELHQQRQQQQRRGGRPVTIACIPSPSPHHQAPSTPRFLSSLSLALAVAVALQAGVVVSSLWMIAL